MRRKIPGTELLIAFETAARHQSFTRAAEELSLTQSAVCRQIAALEDFLGVQLFDRVKKRVTLSTAGQTYAKQIRSTLLQLERDTLSVMAHQGMGEVLELAVIPTFATRWLIPRLADFQAGHPTITLNMTTRAEPFIFTDTPFDAAIHFGEAVWPGAESEYLFGEEMVPVCAVSLLGGTTAISPEQLAQKPLLHQSARPDAWREWFGAAGVSNVNALRGPRYELFSMLVEAARAGLGVALVPRFFVLGEIAARELVIPCPISLQSQRGYYLVYPENKAKSASLQTFRDWLLAQAIAYRRTSTIARNSSEEG
ncbi:LysR family transcriptional regulator [Pseudogulbenkiania sp. MAI-1]|uniref:LysR family transcriptional regulator n=1 Tax=Pseudogulbenkiania sp. MAI-1 TaxID=990370 RepID=UPI00045EC542|nr:LysR family transcriptional regulator [Pseudogulbenkiania sp. MAI-1]